MKTKLTPAKLKTWARKNKDLAMTVVKAKAFAEVERERVDAYVEPVFLKYGFTNDMDPESKGEPLTKSKDLYLSEDEEKCKAFYAECELLHRAHGYEGEPGTCPALVAETLKIKAENLLLASLSKFVGVDGFWTLDLRAKALDLALRVCLAKDVK